MSATEQHRPDVVAARAAFREAQPALDAASLVFVDECGVNVKLARRYGRAHRSRRAVGHAPGGVGEEHDAAGRDDDRGARGARSPPWRRDDEGVVRGLRWGGAVSGSPPRPDGGARQPLGASRRRSPEAGGGRGVPPAPRAAIQPDLNPIEKLWSKLKGVLRGLGARTPQALAAAITEAAAAITAGDAASWVRGAGYPLRSCRLL